MMIIAIAPSFFFKPPKPAPRPVAGADTGAAGTQAPTAAVPAAAAPTAAAPLTRMPVETVTVSGPLYQYGISTRGGAILQATLNRYRALNPDDRGQPVRLIRPGGAINQLAVVVGQDTLRLAD